MKKHYCILDCFVDEPACFGVPPFISPYPRYIYGALLDAGVKPDRIQYLTIDHLREKGFLLPDSYDMTFIIGGAVVPGKYLGAKIGTMAEIRRITETNKDARFVIGGPAASVFDNDSRILPLRFDAEKYAFSLASGAPVDERRSTAEIARWAVTGARVVREHPSWPDIICEMETYRGCPRQQHCSFCSEGLLDILEFRRQEDILAEVDALISEGVSRFRMGRQADILQYMTPFSTFRNGFPEPEVMAVTELFGELGNRVRSEKIRVLNIDNANPGTISNFPDESARMLESIAGAITPGDTLALGIESFDPQVISRNNLKVSAEEAHRVVALINEVCGHRVNGIPVLLPGINLIQGLTGETAETFAINYRSLMEMRDAGLLLKRINIRKHQPFPGTALSSAPEKTSGRVLNRFEFYRSKIRHDIDTWMLKQIYPAGTILKEVMILDHHEGYSLGKEIASYSITARFPMHLKLRSFSEALVVAHRERSLMALTLPVNINSLPQKGLESIPGISRKTAAEIILRRPFDNTGSFISFLAELGVTVDSAVLKHCVAEMQGDIKKRNP